MVHRVTSEVWLYPSQVAAWHFVSLSKQLSAELDKKYRTARKGWNSLPVTVTLGPTSPRLRRASKTTWKTSIFFDKREQAYILPLKADVRKKEGIRQGSKVNFELRIVK